MSGRSSPTGARGPGGGRGLAAGSRVTAFGALHLEGPAGPFIQREIDLTFMPGVVPRPGGDGRGGWMLFLKIFDDREQERELLSVMTTSLTILSSHGRRLVFFITSSQVGLRREKMLSPG
jgi:hypothetical protein